VTGSARRDDASGERYVVIGATGQLGSDLVRTFDLPGELVSLSTRDVDIRDAARTRAVLQNLGLMTQALGLGGFSLFAAHPFGWCEALGFRMQQLPVSRTIGAGWIERSLLRAIRRDLPVPTAVGLERDGRVLLKAYCPPYYRSMREAAYRSGFSSR